MLEELKKEVYEANMKLKKEKLIIFTWGNVSGISSDRKYMVIKPSGVDYDLLSPDKMVVCDMDGNVIEGNLKPSSDYKTHLEIYKARNDVNAIVHTHSPYATGFAFSSKKIKRLEGFGKITTPFLEEIDYLPPGSIKLAKNAAEAIGNEDVLILKHHGVICVADQLKEAANLAEFVEDIAKTQFITHTLNLSEDI